MPTIYYCDYLSGNDSTGNGSAGNPYKTITKASTGLTGGDEVRCAKSAAPSAMSGTMTFTDGSTSVATSVDLTASLAAKDFVGLNTDGETWWEIASINSTTITLVSKYSGTGGTGTGYKLGVTDTGAAAGPTTVIQSVSVSGSSRTSKIIISGGWNLAGTPAQDGETHFWQSGDNKYGDGLSCSGKDYVTIDGRLGFLRYRRGIILNSGSDTCDISSIICLGSGTYGIYIGTSFVCTISDVVCNGCSSGIYMYYTHTVVIQSAICRSNDYGIYLYYSSATISNIIFSSDGYGLYLYTNSKCDSYNCTYENSTYDDIYIYDFNGGYTRITSIGESVDGGAARNRVYFYSYYPAYIQNNTAHARSGSCLQFNPKDATYWTEQSFFVPAAASTARTVAIYLKDDSSFNGNVYLELWFNGVRIAGPTEKTMTTSYVQESITGAADDIPVDGVLELKVLVYGTAGCVYADDISYS